MVSEEEVKKIAKLSYLSIPDSELPTLAKEINAILGYIEQLMQVDVSGVEPMSHVHGSTNVFRADEVEPSMENEAALCNAPDKSGRFIRVPIIVGQGVDN